MLVLAFLVPCMTIVPLGSGQAGADEIITNVIMPGPDNPRNTEGDTIELADGRILLAYTHFTDGSGDASSGFIAGRYSSDGGQSWTTEDVVLASNTGDQNVMSASFIRMQNDDIGMFYLEKNSLQDCRPMLRTSDDEGQTWSAASKCIADDDVGYFVMNNDRVVRLDSGRLVLPVALHNRPAWSAPDWRGELMCYLSDDDGLTWRRSQDTLLGPSTGTTRVTTQEPGVIEMINGSLQMICRTDAGSQYTSSSSDGGETWLSLGPSNIISPRSPAIIERIPTTDELLLVWNDHSSIPSSLAGKRTPFNVGISDDEGQTWHNILTLEDDPAGWYCYPSVDFVGDNLILTYAATDPSIGSGTYATKIAQIPLSMLHVPPPFQMTEKGSESFDWQHEMNVLPSQDDLDQNSTPDFHLFDSTGGDASAELLPGGTLKISSLKTVTEGGAAFCYVADTADEIWQQDIDFRDGFTVEMRVKVLQQTADEPRAVGVMASPVGSTAHAFLGIGADGQSWGNDAQPLGDSNDNTDDFHTFRIVQLPGETTYYVWRDGILVANNLGDGYSYSLDRLVLGDIGGLWAGEVEVDYLRFTSGTFAPVGSMSIVGDVNGDGMVDDVDAAMLAEHWQTQSGGTWQMGDFNGDGRVDDQDATLLAANWQVGMEPPSSVPEPSTVVLLLLGMIAMSMRRRCA